MIFNSDNTVTMTLEEYESFYEDSQWLRCLENAGVDNWSGWDYAKDLLAEELEGEK